MLETALQVVIIGSVVLFGFGLHISSIRSLRNRWSRQAQKLGFTDIETRGLLWPVMTGRLQDMFLAVRMIMVGNNRSGIMIRIDAPYLLPERLELRAESPSTQIEKIREGPDIEVGDATFDDRVLVRGHPVLALALLGAENRQRILELVRRGCQISGSQVVLEIDHALGDDELIIEISLLVDVVRSLRNPNNPAELLARNALEDPLASVRRRNLEMLIARFAHHNTTKSVLLSALEDEFPEVRVKAASALFDEGVDVLEKLLADPNTQENLMAEAIIGLGPRLGSERAIAMLGDALRARRLPPAFAAIEVLGDIASTEAVTRLATVLSVGDDDLATAAAHALGKTGDQAATEALVHALDTPSRAVQATAIDALSRVASVAAVLPLRSFIEAHFIDRELRRKATKAIAAIHERATGAGAGQLSLSVVDEGQLALADDENGLLSLSDSEDR